MPRHEIEIIHSRGLQLVEFEILDRTKTGRQTKKVRHQIWSGMDKEQILKLLRRAYDAGVHAGASNPYA